MSPGRKESPAYQSQMMSSFSPQHHHEFPQEMLPMRMEILRCKDVSDPRAALNWFIKLLRRAKAPHPYPCTRTPQQDTFSASFVAGAYRDNRLGVKELRLKRIERLRKQQATVAEAQAAVVKTLAKMAASREAKRRARHSEKRRIFERAVLILQKLMRTILARRATRALVAKRFAERREKYKVQMAQRLQHWALRCLAFKFEMRQLEEEEYAGSSSGSEYEAEGAGCEKGEGRGSAGSTLRTAGVSTQDSLRSSLRSFDSRSSFGSAAPGEGGTAGPAAALRVAGAGEAAHSPHTPHHHHHEHTPKVNMFSAHLSKHQSEGVSAGVAVSINARMEFKHRKENEARLERLREERARRAQRPGAVAADMYVREGVDLTKVVCAMHVVQRAVRIFVAHRKARLRRNALVLVGWFLGRHLRSAPLELQVVARLGQPIFGHFWLAPRLRLSAKTPFFPKRVRRWHELRAEQRLHRRRQGWVHGSAPQPAPQLAKQLALARVRAERNVKLDAKIKKTSEAAEKSLLARDKPRSPPVGAGRGKRKGKTTPTAAAVPHRGRSKKRLNAMALAPVLIPDDEARVEESLQPSEPTTRCTRPNAASNAWNPALTGKAMQAYIHAYHDRVALSTGYHGKRRNMAVTIQSAMRGFMARRRRAALAAEREALRAKVAERSAKALMARIPAEVPDHSAAKQWLRDGNAPPRHVGRLEAAGAYVSPGAVDLSRTGRNAFWLGSPGSPAELLAAPNGLRSVGGSVRHLPGRQARAVGSSVNAMIGAGLGPYYPPVTT